MNIGIMQSRLSPVDLQRGYQYFPEMWWDNEFKLAKLYGFSHIEWIYDDNPNNLLNTDEGVEQILDMVKKTGVEVKCICADYFIKKPIWLGTDGIKVLNKLIVQAFKLGVRNITLPLIEESSMINKKIKIASFLMNIKPCLDIAGRYMVNICLEADMEPHNLKELIENVGSDRLGICYDSGNVTGQGEDINSFILYYDLIKHIHLKDKVRNQQENVEIGTGNVQFNDLFHLMNKWNYDGTVTLQCSRKEYDLEFIKKQYSRIKTYAKA